MNYVERIKELKGINVNDLFIYAWCDYVKNKDTFDRNGFDHEGDFECTGSYFSMHDIDKYGMVADYEDTLDWDEYEYESFIDTLIKDGEGGYLLYAETYGWNGDSVYDTCDEKIDLFRRDYDFDFVLKGSSNKGKTLMFSEFSHDSPTGCTFYAIALTDRERDMIKNAKFSTVRNFVRKHIKSIR